MGGKLTSNKHHQRNPSKPVTREAGSAFAPEKGSSHSGDSPEKGNGNSNDIDSSLPQEKRMNVSDEGHSEEEYDQDFKDCDPSGNSAKPHQTREESYPQAAEAWDYQQSDGIEKFAARALDRIGRDDRSRSTSPRKPHTAQQQGLDTQNSSADAETGHEKSHTIRNPPSMERPRNEENESFYKGRQAGRGKDQVTCNPEQHESDSSFSHVKPDMSSKNAYSVSGPAPSRGSKKSEQRQAAWTGQQQVQGREEGRRESKQHEDYGCHIAGCTCNERTASQTTTKNARQAPKAKQQAEPSRTAEQQKIHAPDACQPQHTNSHGQPQHPPTRTNAVPLDPTTFRLSQRAQECHQAMIVSHNWVEDFERFAVEMITEIKKSEDRLEALTKEMLAARDRYQPTTDGEFQGLMNKLREFVKNLTRDIVNGLKVQEGDFWAVLSHVGIAKRDGVGWGEKRNRRFLIESAVWRVLREEIFVNPFSVYGAEGKELGKTWADLFSNVDDRKGLEFLNLSHMSEASERWKSLTGLRLDEKYGTGSGGCEEARDVLVEKVVNPLSVGTMGQKYSSQSGWGRNLALVIDCARSLAILMSKQRSRFELFIPELSPLNGSSFKYLGKIVDIEEEDRAPVEGEIEFVVIPGLRRWGDGFGMNLDRNVDLEAARVKSN